MGDAARLLRLLAPGRPACSFCEQAGSHICVSTAVLVYAVHPLVVVLLFCWVPYPVYSCIVAAPPRTGADLAPWVGLNIATGKGS